MHHSPDRISAPTNTMTIYAALVVAALMLILWLVSIAIEDVSIIDPAWGPAFALVALVCAIGGTGSTRWLLLGLTAIWGLRLGHHLARRKLAEPAEDRRYAAMREREGSRFVAWSLVWIFGFQGLLVVIVSLPVQIAASSHASLTAAVIPGVLVFAVGLGFEAIGDAQLTRFKAEPDSKGKVMDRGLWRYTRHPNYFGDFCVWWGVWLVALTAGGTWWTAVGPIVMTILLTRVSGKALLERDMASRRPGYADYVARTSGFFPLPPRARGSSR